MKKTNHDKIFFIGGMALLGLALIWDDLAGSSLPDSFFDGNPGKYFTWDEVQYSPTAEANNIDNTIPANLKDNARMLAKRVLDPIREDLDRSIFVNSWYRSPALNEKVGGSDDSKHKYALAADIDTGSDEDNILIMQSAIIQNLPFNQLIAYDSWDSPTRVHIDVATDGNPRREVGLKKNGQYTWLTISQAQNMYL